jgi:hypothetical protein
MPAKAKKSSPKNLDACVAHFRETPGFHRLMTGLFDAYMRHERCFGAVRLESPTPDEEAALSEFFGRDYYNQAMIRIGLGDFERQAQRRFGGDMELEALLSAYCHRPVVRKIRGRAPAGIFAEWVSRELMPRFENTPAHGWLKEVTATPRRNYRAHVESFLRIPAKITTLFETTCHMLNDLPADREQVEKLNAFALRHAGEAAGFELDGEYDTLLQKALAHRFRQPQPQSRREAAGLYFRAGLLTHGSLNHVWVRGLQAWIGGKTRKRGVLCPVCELHNQADAPHILTSDYISRFVKADAPAKTAYLLPDEVTFAQACEGGESGENREGGESGEKSKARESGKPAEAACLLFAPDGVSNSAYDRLAALLTQNGVAVLDYGG